jgi:hypothetical protein
MVERDDATIGRAVHYHESAAPDAAGERLGDAQYSRRSHRCVNGVPTAREDVERRGRREAVHRGRCPASSDRDRIHQPEAPPIVQSVMKVSVGNMSVDEDMKHTADPGHAVFSFDRKGQRSEGLPGLL